MKHITPVGTKYLAYVLLFIGFFSTILPSCEPKQDELGVTIFPPSDTIYVYTDTIWNLQPRLVKSPPRATSIDVYSSVDHNFFLGSMVDTITGLSKAEIVTEFGITRQGNFGAEPTIDSLRIYLYFADVVGDTTQDMNVTIYEFLDSLEMDSVYYSDYDITGLYDPVPLAQKTIIPKPNTVYEFVLNDQRLYNRILDHVNPEDSIFNYNSRLQRIFHGLYITSETVSSGGALAKVQLANPYSGLKFKYQHDSITESQADTIPFSTYNIGFSQLYAQKVNIFHHDFSGTSIENLIDDENSLTSIGYVQGLSGVNVKFSLPDLSGIIDFDNPDHVAITTARLQFYVMPDSISGIDKEDYPEYLMLDLDMGDGIYETLYDKVIQTESQFFGSLTQSNEQFAFLDPLFYYTFNLGRHLQSVIAGELPNNDLLLYVDDPAQNAKVIKFWCNAPEQKRSLRLELIYTIL